MREAWSSHQDCQGSACSYYLEERFFITSYRHPDLYTCIDVNEVNDVHDVLTFCDFTQSYCKLLMRASA